MYCCCIYHPNKMSTIYIILAKEARGDSEDKSPTSIRELLVRIQPWGVPLFNR